MISSSYPLGEPLPPTDPHVCSSSGTSISELTLRYQGYKCVYAGMEQRGEDWSF
jgi:hypothetical protein